VVEFLPFLHPPAGLEGRLLPVRRALAPFRSVNSYHLFAHMTLVRREAVIEGSADGAAWLPYEFRYKPGDPARPPPFVAPPQPRDPSGRCGAAGAPSPSRLGAAEWGASVGRRAPRVIGGPTAPPLPAALFGLARVPHVVRRHAESKQAMGFRRFMFRGMTKCA